MHSANSTSTVPRLPRHPAFVAVQSLIREFHKFSRSLRFIGKTCNPATETGGTALPPCNARKRQRQILRPCFRRKYGELVPAVAKYAIAFAQPRTQRARRFSKHPISRLMPEPVVDCLEIVEIHKRERKKTVVAARARFLFGKRFFKRCAPGQTRNRIAFGLLRATLYKGFERGFACKIELSNRFGGVFISGAKREIFIEKCARGCSPFGQYTAVAQGGIPVTEYCRERWGVAGMIDGFGHTLVIIRRSRRGAGWLNYRFLCRIMNAFSESY